MFARESDGDDENGSGEVRGTDPRLLSSIAVVLRSDEAVRGGEEKQPNKCESWLVWDRTGPIN